MSRRKHIEDQIRMYEHALRDMDRAKLGKTQRARFFRETLDTLKQQRALLVKVPDVKDEDGPTEPKNMSGGQADILFDHDDEFWFDSFAEYPNNRELYLGEDRAPKHRPTSLKTKTYERTRLRNTK